MRTHHRATEVTEKKEVVPENAMAVFRHTVFRSCVRVIWESTDSQVFSVFSVSVVKLPSQREHTSQRYGRHHV
jgi:hypothetical protein